MDRGAWCTIVHGVAKSRTPLSMHACILWSVALNASFELLRTLASSAASLLQNFILHNFECLTVLQTHHDLSGIYTCIWSPPPEMFLFPFAVKCIYPGLCSLQHVICIQEMFMKWRNEWLLPPHWVNHSPSLYYLRTFGTCQQFHLPCHIAQLCIFQPQIFFFVTTISNLLFRWHYYSWRCSWWHGTKFPAFWFQGECLTSCSFLLSRRKLTTGHLPK